MTKVQLFVLVTAILILGIADAGAQATFTLIDTTDYYGSIKSLSDDGTVGVGIDAGAIFRWEASMGSAIEFLPGTVADDQHVFNTDLSGDGTHIVSNQPDPISGFWNAAIWSADSGWVHLGTFPDGVALDGSLSSGWGVNHDGSVVVGYGNDSGSRAQAFRWSASTGMVGLGRSATYGSRGTRVSGDGSVVVGFYQHPTQGYRLAARWVDDQPVEHFLGETDATDALNISSNGAHIVGNWFTTAFIYDDDGGLENLGLLGGLGADERSVGSAVSDDGTRVVGWDGNPWTGVALGYLWTPDAGMRRLDEVLTEAGANLGDWFIAIVYDISSDGETLAGQAINSTTHESRGFVATLPKVLFADGFESGDASAWTSTAEGS